MDDMTKEEAENVTRAIASTEKPLVTRLQEEAIRLRDSREHGRTQPTIFISNLIEEAIAEIFRLERLVKGAK